MAGGDDAQASVGTQTAGRKVLLGPQVQASCPAHMVDIYGAFRLEQPARRIGCHRHTLGQPSTANILNAHCFFFPGPNRQTKAHPMHRMRIKHSAGERRAWHRERVTRGYSSGHGGGSFFGGHCGVFAGPSFAVGVVLQEGGTARDSRDVPDTTYGPNRQERGELPETIIQEEEGGDAGAPPPSLPSPSPGGCAREGSRSFHKNVPR